MRHALIVGARGVGKSTLIRRVLRELNVPYFGYETKKEKHLTDPIHGDPIYIYPAGAEHVQRPDNLLGYCKQQRPEVHAAAFDRHAPGLTRVPEGTRLILMDEIGFMETASAAFCGAIMGHLDGEIPVLAAVKHNDMPFLEQVRGHEHCRCFRITEENRDALFPEVLAFLRAQLEERQA